MKSKQPETIQILVVEVGNQYDIASDAELKSIGDQFQKALDNSGGVVVARAGVHVSTVEVKEDVTNVFVAVAPEAIPSEEAPEVEAEVVADQEAESNG